MKNPYSAKINASSFFPTNPNIRIQLYSLFGHRYLSLEGGESVWLQQRDGGRGGALNTQCDFSLTQLLALGLKNHV